MECMLRRRMGGGKLRLVVNGDGVYFYNDTTGNGTSVHGSGTYELDYQKGLAIRIYQTTDEDYTTSDLPCKLFLNGTEIESGSQVFHVFNANELKMYRQIDANITEYTTKYYGDTYTYYYCYLTTT